MGRRLAAFALGVALGWGILLAYLLHSLMPFNPVRLPRQGTVAARLWLPQGWSFFTRDPRSEDTLAFIRDPGGEWRRTPAGPHASPPNLLGFRRYTRAQGIEAGLLLTAVPREAWSECADSVLACLDRPAASVPALRNLSPRPSLCGDVALVLQKPLPWAWRASARKIDMPSRLARLRVEC